MGKLFQPRCQTVPPQSGVGGVAMGVAELAYRAGQVVEVPARRVEGDDGGVRSRPVAC